MSLLPREEVCTQNFTKRDTALRQDLIPLANTSSNQQEANQVNRLSKVMGLDPHYGVCENQWEEVTTQNISM